MQTPPPSNDSEALGERVRDAVANGTPLAITGGDTKAFYGRLTQAQTLSTRAHRGVVSYEPTELILTARAGTPLTEVEAVLANSGQGLPFEPPHFGNGATIGGAIASGLSGPARPWTGAARDYVLGTRIINGRGEALRFGGEVMKNVAGYDVSRLMTGALGTLGVLLDVSLKVLPTPAETRTQTFDMDAAATIEQCVEWAGQPLPLRGVCHDGKRLYVRLAGSEKGVASAVASIGGDALADGDAFWQQLREQTLPFFSSATGSSTAVGLSSPVGRGDDRPLWRLSVAPATPMQALAQAVPGDWLLDWGGAQRFVRSAVTPGVVHAAAREHGGHATLFRGGDRTGDVFQPLSPGVARLHERIKLAFDPQGIFNLGRMYQAF